jgi:hypothetical protein
LPGTRSEKLRTRPPTFIADDGIGAFVARLDLLGAEERPLSELVAPLRRYAARG